MLDHPQIVKATFIHKYGDGGRMSAAEKMNLRHEVAKSLLAHKYSSLTKGLEKKATEQHNMELDEWNLILDNISSAKDIPRYVFTLLCYYLCPVDSGLRL